MPEKIRYTRKDLKGPDEFMSTLGRALAWVGENRPKVLAAVAVVVLVVGGALGGRAYMRWEEEKATATLWPHLNKAREFLLAPTAADAEKLARLEQFLAAHVQAHPKSKAALYARYYLGNIAYTRGNYDMSIHWFRAALEGARDIPDMAYLVRTGLAQASEAKGDFAAAAAAYQDAAAGASGELRVDARMGQARTRLRMGRRNDAAALYRAIVTEHPDSPQKDLAELKLSRIS